MTAPVITIPLHGATCRDCEHCTALTTPQGERMLCLTDDGTERILRLMGWAKAGKDWLCWTCSRRYPAVRLTADAELAILPVIEQGCGL